MEGNLFILKQYQSDIDHYYILPTNTVCLFCDIFYYAVEVDPSTVGQFVGLRDKNGKKIFEGDIVLVSWSSSNNTVSETYVVVYSKSGFFCKDKERLLGQLSNYVYRNARTIQCEVIGNIHDNPELLEDVGR